MNWIPAVTLDLLNSTPPMFKVVEQEFVEWRRNNTTPMFPIPESSWYRISPQHSESYLRRNIKNQEVNFRELHSYALDMATNQWFRTGDPITFSDTGLLVDGQKRLWSCYLMNVSFDSFVLSNVPDEQCVYGLTIGGSGTSWCGDGDARSINKIIRLLETYRKP